jgi:carboxyl-terminal processing protease
VGLQVVPTIGGELVVLRVVEDSPAAAAGLKPGDFIFRVDDFNLAGSDFREVVSKYLWGEVGSRVTLHYLRPGVEGERSVSLRRAPIKSKGADMPGVRMLSPDGTDRQ